MSLVRKRFGTCDDREIDLYTVSNGNGLVVSLTTFGAAVTAIRTPDRNGIPGNIIRGYKTFADYRADTAYLGGLIGRCAGGISNAAFTINGRLYRLSANHGRHHLHGGFAGFSKKIWDAQPIREQRGCGVSLSRTSLDGEEGYPGTVDIRLLYLLTEDNRLLVEYTAASDQPTVVSLSPHCYFNLGGSMTIEDHLLRIDAAGYISMDRDALPLGMLRRIDGTPLDFREERLLGGAIRDIGSTMQCDDGFDHYFVLDNEGVSHPSAHVYHPESGRTVTITTSQPGIRLCTGGRLDRLQTADGAFPFNRFAAFCLAPGHFPDSANQRAFPSVLLAAGQLYRHTTCYQFGLRDR